MHRPVAEIRLRGQSGFSLLEVLVALLVISISLLGVAGMQAISIGNTGESGFRSIAATQAASIASAMSTNEQYWQTFQAPAPGNATVSGANVSIGGAAQTIKNCKSYGSTPVACLPPDLANYDLSVWGQQLKAALPGGTGKVTCNMWVNSLTICQVEVDWLEKNQAQNGAATTSGTTYHLDMMVQP
jgi:type IV pilus assembly protein PilV